MKCKCFECGVEGVSVETTDVICCRCFDTVKAELATAKGFVSGLQLENIALRGAESAALQELATANDENKRLRGGLEEIEAVACGEQQIEADGDYDDGDGMKWIYDRTQALKE